MAKHIQILSIFTAFLLSILLFSCAGTDAPNEMVSASGHESYKSFRSTEKPENNRMVTYSASLELSVTNTEETRNIILEQVKSNNGYIIRETEKNITARIPAENMDTFIAYVKTLGTIENESKTGTDITDQYRDNLLRLDSLKTVRNRYLTLLEQAKGVSDILSIEKELERINTEIEVLEGKIKYAEQSAAYSNISVRFNEKTKPGPVGWIFYGLYRGIKWLFVWS